MLCNHSEICIYYRTYRYKRTSSKQFQLLIESYCEGVLQAKCRRLQYENEFCKEAPTDLAPNGYIIGSHKKLRIENTRKHKRYEVKNGLCLLQVPDTKKTFSAWVIDESLGGLKIAMKMAPKELDIISEPGVLKILEYTVDGAPRLLTKELIKMVWQNNQVIGCSFTPSPV